jgi:cell division septum initiation protein DivIVA
MTPEQIQLLEDLKRRVEELEKELNEKRVQQISLPLDPASIKVVARALQDAGYIIT